MATQVGVVALNHVGIRTSKRNSDAMYAFYKNVLGLTAHPEKTNWLSAGETFAVHLMPALWDDGSESKPDDPARHFALQVADLRKALAALLHAKTEPFQASLAGETKPLRSPDDDLNFGIGTIFVHDPDGNVVELVDVKRGIFAQYSYLVSGASSK